MRKDGKKKEKSRKSKNPGQLRIRRVASSRLGVYCDAKQPRKHARWKRKERGEKRRSDGHGGIMCNAPMDVKYKKHMSMSRGSYTRHGL